MNFSSVFRGEVTGPWPPHRPIFLALARLFRFSVSFYKAKKCSRLRRDLFILCHCFCTASCLKVPHPWQMRPNLETMVFECQRMDVFADKCQCHILRYALLLFSVLPANSDDFWLRPHWSRSWNTSFAWWRNKRIMRHVPISAVLNTSLGMLVKSPATVLDALFV